MTEATTDNDKNVSTKSVTAMFENELGLKRSLEREFANRSDTLTQKSRTSIWKKLILQRTRDCTSIRLFSQ